jgi:hypothetical protein
MTAEFEIQRCSRQCASTGRQLEPGEKFFSTLVEEGDDFVRQDYSREAWRGPPEGVVGWWQATMPLPDAHKVHWAPNDVLLDYFERLEGDDAQRDLRYIMALLLVRRRVARHEETELGGEGQETMTIYCPRREKSYAVAVEAPTQQRAEEIQNELAQLLFANAT